MWKRIISVLPRKDREDEEKIEITSVQYVIVHLRSTLSFFFQSYPQVTYKKEKITMKI